MTRSYLFVPGHKEQWIAKGAHSGADALILDLEDSVPPEHKALARGVAANAGAESSVELFVRLNSWASGCLLADVEAVVGAGFAGVLLSKTDSPEDVVALDRVITDVEAARALSSPDLEIVPLLETANGIRSAYDICCASSRVRRVVGVTGPTAGGDVARALHRQWTPDGLEALYSDSKAVLDGRAAGVDQVIAGPSTNIDDLELLEALMRRARQIGADAALAIHPSHVAIINEVFSPSADEIAQAIELIGTVAQSVEAGLASARHGSDMVDYAHVRTALDLLERARRYGMEVGPVPAIALPSGDR